MTAFVVDTNVAIAANGRRTHADSRCQLACVKRLNSVVKGEVVAIDAKGEILQEYRRHLSHQGMPGVGDAFFKHVFDNQYMGDRVRRATVTPSDNDERGFEELPANAFDRSDRKFLAVAVAARAVVRRPDGTQAVCQYRDRGRSRIHPHLGLSLPGGRNQHRRDQGSQAELSPIGHHEGRHRRSRQPIPKEMLNDKFLRQVRPGIGDRLLEALWSVELVNSAKELAALY